MPAFFLISRCRGQSAHLSLNQILVCQVVSGLVMVVVTCAVLLVVFDAVGIHRTMASNSDQHARVFSREVGHIIGEHHTREIEDIVQNLDGIQGVQLAVVWDVDGKLLAKHLHPGLEGLEIPEFMGAVTKRVIHPYRYVESWVPVMYEGRQVGQVYFQYDLEVASQRLVSYAWKLVVCLGVTLLLSQLFIRRLNRLVARPLVEVTETLRRVRESKDYSQRVGGGCGGCGSEIRALYSGINELLEVIGAHDAHLSQEVKLRTRDLQASLDQMKSTNVALDIARTEISRQKALLDSVVALLPQRIFWKDTAGTYMWGNAAFARDTGNGSPKDLIGMRESDLWPEEVAAIHTRYDEQALSTSGQVNYEMTLAVADGRTIDIEVSKMPMVDARGNVTGILGVYADVTEQNEAHAERERLLRELNIASRHAGMAEVATGVLHNVGNVLNSVNVSADTIIQKIRTSKISGLGKATEMLRQHQSDMTTFLTTDEKGKRLPEYLIRLGALIETESQGITQELDSLRRGLEHIQQVITTQQTYARSSTLVMPVEPAEIVSEALLVAKRGKNRNSVEITAQTPPVGVFMIDKHKVMQILVNFISNACRAVSDHADATHPGMVAVKLETYVEESGARWIRFLVSDTGVGLDASQLANLFKHGFTTKSDGHGFGLHACANAAKEMSGRVRALSDGPGKGATFILELPTQAETPTAAAA